MASVGTGGVGAVFGGLAVTANGADNIYAGLGSIWTGQSMETTLHRTVKSSATSVMSAGNAERLATGVDIAAGFGAGWADDVVRAGAKYVEAGNSIAVAGQLAARHGAKFAKVQAGGIAAGTAIGATIGGAQNGWQGALDGALLGANVGSMAGGLAANFAVACFTAGTPLVVDREGNSRPIDEIEVGDFVLARSEFDPDGPLELKRVEEKFVRTAVVMELVVHGQSIKTTAEHPFYVSAQNKFVAAGELQVGEQLVGHDGKLVEIESIGSTDEVTTVYNLRVADFHTYFVGGGLWGFDVWVHNSSYLSRAIKNQVAAREDGLIDHLDPRSNSMSIALRSDLHGDHVLAKQVFKDAIADRTDAIGRNLTFSELRQVNSLMNGSENLRPMLGNFNSSKQDFLSADWQKVDSATVRQVKASYFANVETIQNSVQSQLTKLLRSIKP